jgi:hypothetical protein
MSHGKRWRSALGSVVVALAGFAAAAASVGAGGAGAAGSTSGTSATTTTTATTTTAPTTTTVASPRNIQPPTLSGSPTVGATLVASNGTWSGSNLSFTYRFLRCDANGGGCYSGGSTTQDIYKLTTADLGNTVRVRVTASNSGGSASATSAPSGVIRNATPSPSPTGCPSGTGVVQAGQLTPPARLSVDRQQLIPGVVDASTQQLQVRYHVSACNGRDVQGALVYVTAVPYNQFTIPPEAVTGSDGWASSTMTRLRGFPAASHQQLIVMFVRARAPSQNVLGGVSTRRLVSFPVDLRR